MNIGSKNSLPRHEIVRSAKDHVPEGGGSEAELAGGVVGQNSDGQTVVGEYFVAQDVMTKQILQLCYPLNFMYTILQLVSIYYILKA
jgi:hypothetical protein